MKQTAVEWIYAHLLPFLDFSDVKEREHFRKCLEEAKEIEKEEKIKLIKFSKEMCTADAPVEYIINEYNKYGHN